MIIVHIKGLYLLVSAVKTEVEFELYKEDNKYFHFSS